MTGERHVEVRAFMKNISLVKEETNRNGWSRLDVTLPEEVLTYFRSEAINRKQQEVESFGRDTLRSISYLDILKCGFRFEQPYIDLLESNWMNEVVNELLTPASIMYDFFFLLNNDGDDPKHNRNNFHRDQSYFGGARCSLMFLIPLVDFTEEIGPTEIIPGSHLIESKPSDEFCEAHLMKIIARAGDVIVFDPSVWHRAGTNATKQWRPAIIVRFQLPFLKRPIDLTSVYRTEAEGASDILRKILGFNCQESDSLEDNLFHGKTFAKGQYDNLRNIYYK